MTLLDDRQETAVPERRAVRGTDAEALFKQARRRRRRRWALGSGLAALAVLASFVGALATNGAGGGPGPARVARGRGEAGQGAGGSVSPGSFGAVGNGVLADVLDCVSGRTCFAVVYPQPRDALHDWPKSRGQQVAETLGGETWSLAPGFPRRQWSPQPAVMSCPSASMCAVAVQPAVRHDDYLPARAVAVTEDGGWTWVVHDLPLPPVLSHASVDQIACTDRLHCLASVWAQGPSRPLGAFFSTTDGGVTWAEASTVPPADAGPVVALRCGPSGRCIALFEPGQGGGATLTSRDFGATWARGTRSPFPFSAVVHASCGDASHCMYSTGEGGLAFTQDGGQSWHLSHFPVPGQTVTAVDCASGTACFVATAHRDAEGYIFPSIYETVDGGRSWRSLEVPSSADGRSLSTFAPLSCPTSGGCMGIAQTSSSFRPGPRPPSPQSRPLTRRVVVSSFGPAPSAEPGGARAA